MFFIIFIDCVILKKCCLLGLYKINAMRINAKLSCIFIKFRNSLQLYFKIILFIKRHFQSLQLLIRIFNFHIYLLDLPTYTIVTNFISYFLCFIGYEGRLGINRKENLAERLVEAIKPQKNKGDNSVYRPYSIFLTPHSSSEMKKVTKMYKLIC